MSRSEPEIDASLYERGGESVTHPIRVLLIDDSEDQHVLINAYLDSLPFRRVDLSWEADKSGALKRMRSEVFDVFLVDQFMGQDRGLELVREARSEGVDGAFILMTGNSDICLDMEAMKSGFYDFIDKNVLTPQLLERSIRYSHDRHLREKREVALQQRVFEMRRLESLGLLAGGLAHDLNNTLTAAVGNLHLAEASLDPGTKARERVGRALRILEKASVLGSQMLAYSGRSHIRLQSADLNELIRADRDSLQSRLPGGIEFQVQLMGELLPVKVDTEQLHQLLVQLIQNSAEATSGNGCLRLRTGQMRLDGEDLAACYPKESHEPGLYVFLELEDDGVGIEPSALARVFDPFYSTRGQGRGLGLAIVMGILRSHGGLIRVRSVPGEGTLMRVLFRPMVVADELLSPARVENASPLPGKGESAGKILVIDDEIMLLEAVAATLAREGWSVLCASSGEAGLKLYHHHAQEIAIVLLDMTLPGMSGMAVFQELQKYEPGPKVLLTSGYSEVDWRTSPLPISGEGFLQKPFTPKQLIDKLSCL